MAASQEAWRNARQQISDFEQKSGELQLSLQVEKDSLAYVEKEVASLAAERAAILSKAEEAEAKVEQARKQLVALSARALKAAEEGEVLTKHLEMLRRSKHELTTKLEKDSQQHQEELEQLKDMLGRYRRHLAPEKTAEA